VRQVANDDHRPVDEDLLGLCLAAAWSWAASEDARFDDDLAVALSGRRQIQR
jgi:hypothetical protein